MTIKVGINGFGRIGRLALRAAFDWPEFEFVRINDPAGDAATFAHLLNFDSVHGRWKADIHHDDSSLTLNGQTIRLTAAKRIEDLPLIQYTARHLMGRQIAGHLRRQGVRLGHRFELDSYAAILAMVAGGEGWTITPQVVASSGETLLKLRPHTAWTPMERLNYEFQAVGFYLSEKPQSVRVLMGNAYDQVTAINFPRAQVKSYRLPPD